MFDPGRLRERITIERRTESKGATGGLNRSWGPIAGNLAANVICLNGRESVIGNALQGVSTFEITVRFRQDLRVSDRVTWNGRELNIVTPPEDRLGSRQWTVFHASTQGAQGN